MAEKFSHDSMECWCAMNSHFAGRNVKWEATLEDFGSFL